MSHKNELPIPGRASNDPEGRELARVWAAGGAQHVALATGLWSDPGNWGIVLADLARHLARSYELAGTLDQTTALKRIREVLDAEWSHPTDEPTGSIQS
jgi:hypothetical protein